MLSAKDARAKMDVVQQAELEENSNGCEAALEFIDVSISQSAGLGRNYIEFKWDGYRSNIQTVFKMLKEDLWHYDGGDGTDDEATWSGTYIANYLRQKGYDVTLGMGLLRISW